MFSNTYTATYNQSQLSWVVIELITSNQSVSDKTIHKSFVFWVKVSLCNQYKKRKYLLQSLAYCNSEYAFFSHYQMSNNGYQKSKPQYSIIGKVVKTSSPIILCFLCLILNVLDLTKKAVSRVKLDIHL